MLATEKYAINKDYNEDIKRELIHINAVWWCSNYDSRCLKHMIPSWKWYFLLPFTSLPIRTFNGGNLRLAKNVPIIILALCFSTL